MRHISSRGYHCSRLPETSASDSLASPISAGVGVIAATASTAAAKRSIRPISNLGVTKTQNRQLRPSSRVVLGTPRYHWLSKDCIVYAQCLAQPPTVVDLQRVGLWARGLRGTVRVTDLSPPLSMGAKQRGVRPGRNQTKECPPIK